MKRLLQSLLVVILSAALGYGGTSAVVGCGSWLQSFDEVNDPKDDVKLNKCRVEARAEKQITGDAQRASDAYFACTDDAGLPRPTAKK